MVGLGNLRRFKAVTGLGKSHLSHRCSLCSFRVHSFLQQRKLFIFYPHNNKLRHITRTYAVIGVQPLSHQFFRGGDWLGLIAPLPPPQSDLEHFLYATAHMQILFLQLPHFFLFISSSALSSVLTTLTVSSAWPLSCQTNDPVPPIS